jgi:hypothetical protein
MRLCPADAVAIAPAVVALDLQRPVTFGVDEPTDAVTGRLGFAAVQPHRRQRREPAEADLGRGVVFVQRHGRRPVR